MRRHRHTLAGLRDRALLLLGFAAAMRRSELVALDVEDLDFRRRAGSSSRSASPRLTRSGQERRWRCRTRVRETARSGWLVGFWLFVAGP
jgi:integrase